MIPTELRYTTEHEWVRLQGDQATVGITDHAQNALSDIVFVELPEPGAELSAGDEAAVVESTKAAASVYAPVAGTVSAVNDALADDPGTVNRDCYGEGWLYKLTVADPGAVDALMDSASYEQLLAGLEQ